MTGATGKNCMCKKFTKNHRKPSQIFSERSGPFIHEMKGFSGNSPPKAHANFAQNLGRQILRNTFSGPKDEFSRP